MENEHPDDVMIHSGDNAEDIKNHETIPGGEQKTIPVDPAEVSTNSEMGCGLSKRSASTDKDEETKAQLKQKKIDEFFQPENRDGSAHGKNNEQKKTKTNNDLNSRPKSKTSAQSGSDDGDNENENDPKQRAGAVTRSSAALSGLRMDFDDSDDEDSRYSSWAKRDIAEYRSNYPDARQNSKINDNYLFYTNKISSHPDGDLIDNIHKEWLGNYRELEFHHGYIQWLFPLQEKGLNWSAEPLQKHEIDLIRKDEKAWKRILESYKLMLDFYGFKLVDDKTGEIRRKSGDSYKDRFRNLNTSSHNYLRITRILKCLGEFDYEHLKFPFLEQILRESIIENTLPNCLRSCKDYWIETLRDRGERRAIRQYARDLVEYRNKGSTPPKAFRAHRPSPTTTKINQLSSATKSADDHSK